MGEPRNVGYMVIINKDRAWFLPVLCAKSCLIPAPPFGFRARRPGCGSQKDLIYLQCEKGKERKERFSRCLSWPTGTPPGQFPVLQPVLLDAALYHPCQQLMQGQLRPCSPALP